MAITYTNRQKKNFYLHVGSTKKGNPKYYLALTQEGNLADRIPDGFEIHEKSSGQVVVRRKRIQLITEDELAVVQRKLATVKEVRRSYAEREGDFIAVYAVRQLDGIEEMVRGVNPLASQDRLDELINQFFHYDEVFRFVLTDAKKRLFQAQRFCYLGSIDDWIFIGKQGLIEKLASQYLPHINQESYFDLM